ncbi:MAG: EAL domain-containing protein [Actinomycetota bacterium]
MAEVELDTGFFGTSVTREEEPDTTTEDSYVATRAGALVDSADTSAPDDTVVHGVFDGAADEVPPPPPPPPAAAVQDMPPPPPAALSDDALFGTTTEPVEDQAFGAPTNEPTPVQEDAFEVDVEAIMADVHAIVADVAPVGPNLDAQHDEDDVPADDDAELDEVEVAQVDSDESVEPVEADGQAVWEGATDEPTVWDTPAPEATEDAPEGETWSGATATGDDTWAGADDATAEDTEADAEAADTPSEAAPPEPVSSVPAGDTESELDRIMQGRLVTMMYQPITSLLDDSVVGYEALARGPEDSPLATPAAMFEAAEMVGRLKELDLMCQDQAVVQARDVLLKSGHALFVNVEASVLCDAAFGRDPDAAASFSALLGNITAACPVVLEISDRYDFASPAELLGVTMWARAHGFRVAIDDVGVQPKSLAILPLLEPDVIKLERGITSATPDADLGQLLSVVRSQSERTGAAVICQGIETAEERDIALSFGATHVQGYAIGYPEELSDAPLRIRSLEPVGASWGEPCQTPFELVANSSALRTGTEDLILALTLDLERQAAENVDAVVLSSFEKTVNAPAAIASRYEHLAEELDFVVALGEDLGEMHGVFTGDVDPGDPLEAERAVVILTPQFSAALLARVAGGEAGNREYAYALIYDRGQVTRAARMLTAHVEL